MNRNKTTGTDRTARDLLPVGADSRLIAFFDAWRASRPNAIEPSALETSALVPSELVPSRRDFDPFEVPALLRFAWLYRFDPDQGDFVCLLAGEDVNRAWGSPIKGRMLREIVGEQDHPTVLQRWREIIDTPLVQYGAKDEQLSGQDLWRAERLLLPLSSGGDRPDHVIGVSLYRLAVHEQKRAPLISEDIHQIPCSDI